MHAEEIGLEYRLGLCNARLLGSAEKPDAGIVDEHIKAAGARAYLLDHHAHGLVRSNVQGNDWKVRVYRARLRSTARPEYRKPLRLHGQRDGSTDPRSGTGHHNRASDVHGCMPTRVVSASRT